MLLVERLLRRWVQVHETVVEFHRQERILPWRHSQQRHRDIRRRVLRHTCCNDTGHLGSRLELDVHKGSSWHGMQLTKKRIKYNKSIITAVLYARHMVRPWRIAPLAHLCYCIYFLKHLTVHQVAPLHITFHTEYKCCKDKVYTRCNGVCWICSVWNQKSFLVESRRTRLKKKNKVSSRRCSSRLSAPASSRKAASPVWLWGYSYGL